MLPSPEKNLQEQLGTEAQNCFLLFLKPGTPKRSKGKASFPLEHPGGMCPLATSPAHTQQAPSTPRILVGHLSCTASLSSAACRNVIYLKPGPASWLWFIWLTPKQQQNSPGPERSQAQVAQQAGELFLSSTSSLNKGHKHSPALLLPASAPQTLPLPPHSPKGFLTPHCRGILGFPPNFQPFPLLSPA